MTPLSTYLSLCGTSYYTLLALCFCLFRPGGDNWLLTVGMRPKTLRLKRKEREKKRKLLRIMKNSAAQGETLPMSPVEKSVCHLTSVLRDSCALTDMAYFHSLVVSLQAYYWASTWRHHSPSLPLALTAACQIIVSNQERLTWSWRRLEIFVSFV